MAYRNRPGHRQRGREGSSSPPHRERILVLPGEALPSQGLRPGAGTYRMHGTVYASVLGFVQERPPFVQIVPLSGRYIPKPDDAIVGYVVDVQVTFWLLDIGAPRWAPLHMTGTPWKIEVGETERYLRVGDAVYVRVENIDPTGRIGVTMLGEGLGRLEGGAIITLSAAKVPRVIGRRGSMIDSIVESTGARLAVGQNGRIWVGGSPEAILKVRQALDMIEGGGHRSGLTERVQDFLRSTPAPDPRPDESAGRPPAGGPTRDQDDPAYPPHSGSDDEPEGDF
ncbi:MAG: exosome complex RNA-binding protein Rrp4 [Thermoplasmata archaeon]